MRHKTRIFTNFSKSIFKIYVYWIFYHIESTCNNLWFSKEDKKIEKAREVRRARKVAEDEDSGHDPPSSSRAKRI